MTEHFTDGARLNAELNTEYERLSVEFRTEEAPEYAGLVVPSGNSLAPVHRWFHFKEAYSCRLLDQVLKDTELLTEPHQLRVLDPFAGTGTTGISLADMASAGSVRRATFYGLECNGFLHLVSSTKLQAFQTPSNTFKNFCEEVIRLGVGRDDAVDLPALTTLHDPRFFDRDSVRQLTSLVQAVRQLKAAGADPLDASLTMIAIGSCVEAVGNIRRDGRALRYTEKANRPSVIDALRSRAHIISQDLEVVSAPCSGRVIRGDGRTMTEIDGRFEPFDLILFSPPYPNNIDYTEVYKLENWLLGFIEDQVAFSSQRLRTVYSHPSLLRPDPLPASDLSHVENAIVEMTVSAVVAAVPDDKYAEGRRRMFRGYALDMYRAMRSARTRIADDGYVVYVVGNSVHGKDEQGFVVAADLLMAQLAIHAGFCVERIAVARQLRRRSSESRFLRESVVFLRPA